MLERRLTSDEGTERQLHGQTFADGGVDKVQKRRVSVDGEAMKGPSELVSGDEMDRTICREARTDRLAAFAVSITLPPPTLEGREPSVSTGLHEDSEGSSTHARKCEMSLSLDQAIASSQLEPSSA